MPNSPPSLPISMRSASSLSRRALLAASASAALAGCTSLDALNGLNAVTPGDGDTEQRAADIFFGEGPRQALDIYGPKGAPGPLPVIVFFYGGSWASGRRQDYGFAARALAARGFVVVVPDYRLVPAYAFPSFVEDGASAVAWTAANIANHGGDPARISVMGHSAGGYIALMLALDPQWMGQDNPITAADQAFGHVLDPASTQPITFAGPAKPRVLLLQGEDDDTVGPHNARNLKAALTAAGSRAEAIFYPGLGHIGILLALSKPFRGKAKVLEDATRFLLSEKTR